MHKLIRRGSHLVDAGAARMTVAVFNGRRRQSRRGVTMIEYVLLIAISVVLAVILRTQLTSMFNSILSDIRSALQTK